MSEQKSLKSSILKMKNLSIVVLLTVQLAFTQHSSAQNIAINEVGNLPDTSAMLDISSVTKGLLTPRMTTTQQNAIPVPAKGLLIFNLTDNEFKVNTGTSIAPVWSSLATVTGTIKSLNGITQNTQTFATGSTGTDFNIASSGTIHTFNIPDASTSNRGLVTSGSQTFAGNKKFNGTITAGSLSSGATTDSIVTTDATGLLKKRTIASVMSGSSTNALLSNTNTLTSTVNGTAATSPIVNSNVLTLTGVNLVSAVNGILSPAIDMSSLTNDRWKLTGNTGTTPGTNFLGTLDNTDFIFKTNNIEAMRLTGPRRLLGLNVSNPIYRIQVEDPGGPDADIATRMYNTSNQGYFPSMQLQVSAGTKSAPLPVTSGTILGALHFAGYDGSAFNDVVTTGIVSKTTQNWTTSGHGSYLIFKTIANNSTAESERMKIDHNGYVGIGTSAPGSLLDVKGTIRLSGATSGYVGFSPAAAAGSTTYTLPAADGVVGQSLTTSGAGTLSWAYPNSPFSWGVNGNTATTDANFIGTTDNVKLNMKINNVLSGQLSPNRDGAVSFGQYALNGATGIQNTAVGYYSLNANTGNFNTSVGNFALTTNTSGSVNTALGHEALRDNTTGGYNTALGAGAMKKSTSGGANTAVGANALGEILTGQTNTAVGDGAIRRLTTGSSNTGVGEQALFFNISGDNNTSIGLNSLLGTTASNNVGIGYSAGSINTTGTSNIFIGENSQPTTVALTNATAIGSKATVAQSNSMVLGSINGINGAVSNTNVGIGTTIPGSSLDVKGTLRLSGATSGYVGFAPAAVAGSTTYTLPAADGSNGQLLTTNGSGILNWSSAAATSGFVPYTGASAAVNLGSNNLSTTGTTSTGILSATGNTTLGTNTSNTININGALQGSNALVFDGATAGGNMTTLNIVDPTANNVITVPNTTGTLMTKVIEDATPALGGNLLVNNKSIDITAALITNLSYVGTYETAVAGEAVVFGDVLYLDFATNKWKKANANAPATTPVQRMALENIAGNASGKMLIEGFIRNDAWSFGAAPVYLSATTTGVITTTQPATAGNQIQRIGIAFNSNKLHFKPSMDVGEL
ncbi:hypothetical protein BH11BAC3_BH11BAC3_20870 [soil metagenome]